MPVIYVKNYKGFQEACFPVRDVNFLVGENSTGKTSILNLIALMQENQFWTNSKFTIGDKSRKEVDLGQFSQIKNQESNADFFSIGILSSSYHDDGRTISAIHLSFKEHQKAPTVHEIKYISGRRSIFARIEEEEYWYSVAPFDPSKIDSLENDISSFFRIWINQEEEEEFKSLQKGKSKISPGSILGIIEAINMELTGKGEKIQFPRLFDELILSPPIRSEPKNRYSFQNDPDLIPLEKLLKSEQTSLMIRNFGQNSGLFDNISFARITERDFQVKVRFGQIDFDLDYVGYGVSQILPILTDLLFHKRTGFAIQQPEIHLHPKAQAEFGEFLFNSAFEYKNQFIVETHSDYLLDRFRYLIKKNPSSPEAQILFFQQIAGINYVHPIKIEPSGQYEDNEALSRFRKFFIREDLKIIQI